MPVGLLEVLRRQVDVHVAGEVASRAGDRRLEQVADLGVFAPARDPADVLVELPAGALIPRRVLGNAAHALAGQIIDHPAPGLVVVVELVDGGDPEQHRGQEGQARGEHAEYDLPGQRHPDQQSPEHHHEQQEETRPLRFKHSFSSPASGHADKSAAPRAGRTTAQPCDHNDERPEQDVKFPGTANVRAARSAVEVGFEPTEGLPPHTLSRRAPSATRRLHRRRAYLNPGVRGGTT